MSALSSGKLEDWTKITKNFLLIHIHNIDPKESMSDTKPLRGWSIQTTTAADTGSALGHCDVTFG